METNPSIELGQCNEDSNRKYTTMLSLNGIFFTKRREFASSNTSIGDFGEQFWPVQKHDVVSLNHGYSEPETSESLWSTCNNVGGDRDSSNDTEVNNNKVET
jgi:hypothetical protein